MGESKVSLKLLVDTKANRVLFAEAGKDFVDFLFHIFSLPVGTMVKLLSKKDMTGCLGDLYQSIELLSNDYIQPNLVKDCFLQPKVVYSATLKFPLLKLNDNAPNERKFFRCQYDNYVADWEGAVCPNCSRGMSYQMSYVPPKNTMEVSGSSTNNVGGGYVKGVVTYMVMDNLEVKPMSTISGITFINKFNVKDLASLAEKVVELGFAEAVALLEASLQTNAVLTSVFIGEKKNYDHCQATIDVNPSD